MWDEKKKKRMWDISLPNWRVKEREGSVLRKEAASDLICPGLPRMPLLLTDFTSCGRNILRSSTAGEENGTGVGIHSGRDHMVAKFDSALRRAVTPLGSPSTKLPCSPWDCSWEVDALPCHLAHLCQHCVICPLPPGPGVGTDTE